MEAGDCANHMYKECQRNHAASFGSYVTDGCGEFAPDPLVAAGFICDACGCHRSFHRKVVSFSHGFQSQHQAGLLAEMIAMDDPPGAQKSAITAAACSPDQNWNSNKRFRTKFTEDQKEKMAGFAENLGWRMRRRVHGHEDEIERFCCGVGISRKVFKVWMHNHKHSAASSPKSCSLTHDSPSRRRFRHMDPNVADRIKRNK